MTLFYENSVSLNNTATTCTKNFKLYLVSADIQDYSKLYKHNFRGEGHYQGNYNPVEIITENVIPIS